MTLTIELLAMLATIVAAVSTATWSLAWFFSSRFKQLEEKILKQVSSNRRNSDAQFYALGLRMLRVELKLGVDNVLPAIGDNSKPEEANGNDR